ncbi:hypothetical protein H6F73_01240 [Microcoleus sp. FACHB-68]|nr:hypothetical protein [Microcoleus sp. FACHB-68]MBD1935950.1 hypothetical protein [Microcoleus sp. FACHB-68]
MAVLAVALTVATPALKEVGNFGMLRPQPVFAQQATAVQAGAQVYQRLPDFPLENDYVNQETGKVDPDNTLVSRLIRYHIYVKGRPPNYRLDWKLTLADYLGANELIDETVYPGRDVLRENPMEKDRAVISRLDRTQRDALIQALVTIFNPNYENIAEPEPAPNPAPDIPQTPNRKPLPQAGDADLLKHQK